MRKFCFCLIIVAISLMSLRLASAVAVPLEMKMLEVAYLFDEGDGKTAQDISPNKRHGTLEGGVKYGPGKFGTGLIYDGTDDNLIVKGYRGVGGSEARTVLYWFKSASVRDHSWVKWGSGELTKKYYVRGHVAEDKCYLRIENAGGNNWGDVDVCDGKWHHHAVVFPAGAKNVQDHKIYVDGKLNAKFGAAKELDTDSKAQEVVMGAKLLHHTFMHGSFDEPAIFNVALPVSQIQLIMTQGLASALNDKSTAIEPRDKLSTSWAIIRNSY